MIISSVKWMMDKMTREHPYGLGDVAKGAIEVLRNIERNVEALPSIEIEMRRNVNRHCDRREMKTRGCEQE